jgi:DNA-binding NtrC family response regulator
MSARLLIADADPVHRRHLEATVNRFGYAAETVENGLAARERLLGATAARGPAIDLLILDLASAGLDVAAMLAALARDGQRTPTILQAAPGAIEPLLGLVRAGASDFIVKPVGAERLKVSLENALHLAALEEEVRRLGRQATGCASFAQLVGASSSLDRVVRLGKRAARTTMTVLLEGEAGTGKEAVARAIHGESDRRGRPFVPVSCRTLPAEHAWSILFGQNASGFGGALEHRSGKLLEAQGGTLFLDEVDALPLEIQIAILRALQAREIDPVGAKRPVKLDIRFIVATSRNLIELVTQGLFREDLFYRLSMFPIAIPPLRARGEDIGDLARRFCARFAAEQGRSIRGLGAEALALLESYDWPGNVRQLENAVYRAVILAEADELTVAEFPQVAARAAGFSVRIPPLPPPVGSCPGPQTHFVPVAVRDPNVLALLGETGEMRRLDRLEAEAIRFAQAHYRGHMSAMARGLGIGRSTLYRKMREHGLGSSSEDTPEPDEPGATPSNLGGTAA